MVTPCCIPLPFFFGGGGGVYQLHTLTYFLYSQHTHKLELELLSTSYFKYFLCEKLEELRTRHWGLLGYHICPYLPLYLALFTNILLSQILLSVARITGLLSLNLGTSNHVADSHLNKI